MDLFKDATEELTGKVDYRHTYLNFTDIQVELDGNSTVVRTCPAALGPGFAAGTTDGPGFPGFQQGDLEVWLMRFFTLLCVMLVDRNDNGSGFDRILILYFHWI